MLSRHSILHLLFLVEPQTQFENLMDNLETVRCAICDDNTTETVCSVPPWNYVKCKNCSLIYVNPRSKENAVQHAYEKGNLRTWFKQKTYSRRKLASLKNIDNRLKRGETLMYEIAKYKQGGNILDIGCNRGFLLANAAAWGWDAYGIEIVSWKTKLVQNEFDNVTIFNERLGDIDPPFKDKFFDAITMIDIIEHFHDPIKDMTDIHRVLKDDGFLLINTPDMSSAWLSIQGDEWKYDKPKEHLYLFDRNTLKLLLEKIGFEIMSFHQSKGYMGEMEVHVKKKT